MGEHVTVYDPGASKRWKQYASHQMIKATKRAAPLEGPVSVTLIAAFACPKADHRKQNPARRRWSNSPKDLDNIVKAALAAANGVIWQDDRQVVRLEAYKVIAEQGAEPYVEMVVKPIEGEPPMEAV